MNSIEYVGLTELKTGGLGFDYRLHSASPTPLLRISRLSELTGCEILAKAEFLNPSGSVKYRTALGIVEDAEEKGLLHRGDTIVEGSAGNTGIGLTVVANAKGYRTVIVICDTESPEKIQRLRALGAEVITVREQPHDHPENFNRIAQRLAQQNGWFWSNQFDNVANRLAHYRATGPEIWEQTEGKVTGFVSVVGTGGTLAGTGTFLKEQNPEIIIACADPHGAAMWSWFARGKTETSEGDSIAEGIGQTRVTRNLAGVVADRAYRIDDQTALTLVRHLLREEGLCVGLSSGINLAGAVQLALEGGPGQVISTILCDSGQNYQSRLFNDAWLAEHLLNPNLPIESVLDA